MKSLRKTICLLTAAAAVFLLSACRRQVPQPVEPATVSAAEASAFSSAVMGQSTVREQSQSSQPTAASVRASGPSGTDKEPAVQTATVPKTATAVSSNSAGTTDFGETEKTEPPFSSSVHTLTEAVKTVNITVQCGHALNKVASLPQNGVMLTEKTVIENGDSALSALKKAAADNNISVDESHGYIKGIGGLYEKQCGGSSGWMYTVNGQSPAVSAAQYALNPGDTVIFYYVSQYGDEPQ